ncbi:MAG: flagellar protein [Candidatus Riflebacteria bacterium HGW-Riflebacteria-2]|jgi:flagellar protein FlbD|nr:MAG: flagellar protein [Candidatus Riflebacteria bacterium HGW-Riflebacteria-2]
MIRLSRINGAKFYLNAELIEQIESSPDTVITLYTGKTVMVAEPVHQVLHRIMNYKRRTQTHRLARKKSDAAGTALKL